MTDGRLAYAEEITRFFRQVVGVVLVSWRRILRAGLVSGALTLLGAEIAACLVTGSFPPPTAAHLATVALALAIGYSVAVTMLFAILLRGGIRFIRYLEGDVAVGAQAVSVFARREAREAREGHRARDLGASVRLIVLGGEKRSQTAPRPTLPARSRPNWRPRPVVSPGGVAGTAAVTALGLDVTRIALPRGLQTDVRRDPDDAVLRAPAPMMPSLPVLASRLPRIEWTDDSQSAPRPLPVASTLASAPAAPVSSVTPPAPVPETTAAPPPPAPVAENGRLPSLRQELAPSRDVAEDSPEPETSGGTPDAPGLIPRGWRRTDASTRPLPAITRPLPTPSGARAGSLWERVSQALVGEAAPTAAVGAQAETQTEVETEVETEVAEDARPETLSVRHEVAPEDTWLNG